MDSTEQRIIEEVKNGNNRIFNNFKNRQDLDLLTKSHREFVEELIKLKPNAYVFAVNSGEFKGDLDIYRLVAKVDDTKTEFFPEEIKELPEFKDILVRRENAIHRIMDNSETIFKAFKSKKLKLENVHPYAVKDRKGYIIHETEQRLMQFFEEKTKDLAENDTVKESLQNVLADKMKQFKDIINKKLALVDSFEDSIYNEKLSQLEKLDEDLSNYVKNLDQLIAKQNVETTSREIQNFEV